MLKTVAEFILFLSREILYSLKHKVSALLDNKIMSYVIIRLSITLQLFLAFLGILVISSHDIGDRCFSYLCIISLISLILYPYIYLRKKWDEYKDFKSKVVNEI